MARKKLGDSNTVLLQMKITEDELQSVKDWAYEDRQPSTSAAIRELIKAGLEAKGKENEDV